MLAQCITSGDSASKRIDVWFFVSVDRDVSRKIKYATPQQQLVYG